jgi:hypothetical protein
VEVSVSLYTKLHRALVEVQKEGHLVLIRGIGVFEESSNEELLWPVGMMLKVT